MGTRTFVGPGTQGFFNGCGRYSVVADRPLVILNMAATVDGRIALRGKRPLKLSSEEDFARVHRLRGACDAVLVGVETAIADDPKLTVKEAHAPGARHPLRVVLDSQGRLPQDAAVLDGRAPTLVVTSEACERTYPGADVLRYGRERVDLPRLLEELAHRGVRTLLVEGGSTVAWSFLREGLVDRFHLYLAPAVLGDADAPPLFAGNEATTPEALAPLRLEEMTLLGGGVLLTFVPLRGRPAER